MIPMAPIEGMRCCTLKDYRNAWAVGTGLQVGLKPGRYRITGEGTVNGVPLLHLDGAYRCPAGFCEEVRWQQADWRPASSGATYQRV